MSLSAGRLGGLILALHLNSTAVKNIAMSTRLLYILLLPLLLKNLSHVARVTVAWQMVDLKYSWCLWDGIGDFDVFHGLCVCPRVVW